MNITDGKLFTTMLRAAYLNLEKNKEEVNRLNVFPVPDGDTGTNMSLTLKSAIKNMESENNENISKIAKAFSTGSLMGARGNSGVITSQILRGFAQGIEDSEIIDVETLKNGLVQAYKVAYKAVMKPTEGTILTVIRGIGEFAEKNYKNYVDVKVFFDDLIKEGKKVLDSTPEMLPVLKQAGVVDAGGMGLIVILDGILNYENIDSSDSISVETVKVNSTSFPIAQDTGEDIKYGYCTEFMIETDYGDYLKFRNDISKFGDSILVVKGDGLIKTHIHTNNPGVVLEKALQLGQLKDVKIDNMRIQHNHIIAGEEADKYLDPAINPDKKTKYGFISVSSGDGFSKLFKELGVNEIISGGQTMNPSTETILEAIDKINSDNIFVFPNNGNIILAAEQAKSLSEKNIIVIKSKTIPQGITSLLSFDEELSPEENEKEMNEVLSTVKTAQLTFSIRDTEINGLKIKKDDIIGLEGGEILSTGKKLNKVTLDLLNKIIDEDSSLITVYYGEDTEDKYVNDLERKLTRIYQDLDIEFVNGGQPLYYYIISVE
ncbi:DAK2 domain-containing protein [Miniphocaeibacter halophilus]|uniref:DAK2 domain-containing protein n=1 Tax=Miniphocaeibacter halophilus TaxID=2931922 RepID=A0AC61MQ81_9FIRM|nr:DAK2 domain-containing protein [Miniphocaeibacter halophilus]QQK07749.1 DAK2 domain-containing protein [Miniphocaeibacter halophilus]